MSVTVTPNRLVLAILALALAAAAPAARADVVYLEGGGKIRGEIIEETPTQVIVRTPVGSTHVIRRGEIARIERDRNPDQEFDARWKALPTGDANGFFELGKFAKAKGLKEKAERAFNQAISIDPDHAGAREALGHRKHKGRWYDEAGYKKAVEGLVEWNGQWVTPEDRDLLEQGFVKNSQGQWVRKEDLARQEQERRDAERAERERIAQGSRREEKPEKRDDKLAGGTPTTSRPAKVVEVEPEDTAWYDDHATVMSWKDAEQKPYESEFYYIYTNIKPEYAKRYGRMLDVYARKFMRVFNAEENIKGKIQKSKIYIYPDQAAFMQHERMGEGVGGYYMPGAKYVKCFHGRFGPTGTTRTVLTHEATHQFEDLVLAGKMGNAPIWIIEGFAVFFESARWNGKDVDIGHVPRDRLENLKRGIQANQYIPLPELIRTEHAAFTGYHYAHAWSVIYYMLYGGKTDKIRKHNQKIFSDLFFLAKTRLKPVQPEDVEALWGGKEKFAAWEEEWKKWVLELPYDFNPKDPDAAREKDPAAPPEGEPPASEDDTPGETEPRPPAPTNSLKSGMLPGWDEALDDVRKLETAGRD